MIWSRGGPIQVDTYDMKPEAPVRRSRRGSISNPQQRAGIDSFEPAAAGRRRLLTSFRRRAKRVPLQEPRPTSRNRDLHTVLSQAREPARPSFGILCQPGCFFPGAREWECQNWCEFEWRRSEIRRAEQPLWVGNRSTEPFVRQQGN